MTKKPGDFYTYILNEVLPPHRFATTQIKVLKKGKSKSEQSSLERLSKCSITRKKIKTLVMTYSYNASTLQMVNSFKQKLIPGNVNKNIPASGGIFLSR